MKNFVVFVEGEYFNLKVNDAAEVVGFFASRRIEAETEDQAITRAISQLLLEPELQGNALPNHNVKVNVVHEMPMEHKNIYSGFTFFPMEES